jgi:hypothetical protein
MEFTVVLAEVMNHWNDKIQYSIVSLWQHIGKCGCICNYWLGVCVCGAEFLSTTHIHTPNQDKSIKSNDIIHHFPYNVIISLYSLYFILFIAELHIKPHFPIFYHNNTLLYCILSFQQFITSANTTVNSLKKVY